MHSAVAHLPLVDAQPKQQQCHPQPTPQLSSLAQHLMVRDIPRPAGVSRPGSARSQLLVQPQPPSSLPGQHQKPKSPGLCVRPALQQLTHRCAFSTTLILSPAHSTVPATKKKTNSTPDKTRTSAYPHEEERQKKHI